MRYIKCSLIYVEGKHRDQEHFQVGYLIYLLVYIKLNEIEMQTPR